VHVLRLGALLNIKYFSDFLSDEIKANQMFCAFDKDMKCMFQAEEKILLYIVPYVLYSS